MPPLLQYAALTDIGLIRRRNEDSCVFDSELALAVVCDGMGGLAAGDLASQLASNVFMREFAIHPRAHPVELRMALAIRAANVAVYNAAPEHGHHAGSMGTTLVAAAVRDARLLIGNVGDSRAYLLRGAQCLQITADHSYLAEAIRSGRVREQDLAPRETQRFGALITRAIGVAEDVDPDFFSVDLEPGDRVLLATDGLTRYLECEGILRSNGAGLEAVCQALIDEAKLAGGVDNITTLLIEYSGVLATESSVSPGTPR